MSGWFSRAGVGAGARAIAPLAIGVFPFGLAYGVAVATSDFNHLAGALASLLIVAGAAQLAILDLVDSGAPWFVVVLIGAHCSNLRSCGRLRRCSGLERRRASQVDITHEVMSHHAREILAFALFEWNVWS